MSRWIDQAGLVRVEDFEGRRQVVRQDREKVQKKGSCVIWKEREEHAGSVVLMGSAVMSVKEPQDNVKLEVLT